MCGDVVEIDPRHGLREQVVERRRPVSRRARALRGGCRRPGTSTRRRRGSRRVSSCSSRMRRMCSTRSSSVSTWPYIIVAVVEMPSRCAWRMTPSHSPVFVFFGAMILRTRSTRISRAAAGDRVETGVAQPRQRLRDRQLRAARDVLDLGRRQRVQVDLVARLDRAEQILVVVDVEVGMVAALHEQARAADRERLLDLLEDDRLREQIALARVARPPVERAEVAVRVADVRVVEVPVDDERDPLGVVLAVADLVRDAADGDEVARAEQLDRLLVREALALDRLLEDPAVHRDATRRRSCARSGAPAPSRAAPRRGRARGTCTGRRARAGRSGSGASRSSGRGSPAGSRTARMPRTRAAPARRAHDGRRRPARPRARRGRPRAAPGTPRRRTPSAARCARATAGRGRRWGVGSSKADFERRVADQQLRVRLLPERDVLGLRQQHLRQHHRRRGLRRDRDDAYLLERLLRHELDRLDRALGGDAQAREQPQLVRVARILDRRDRRRVELAGDEHLVQLGRDAEHLFHLGLDAVEDGRHVDVRDAAEHQSSQRLSSL